MADWCSGSGFESKVPREVYSDSAEVECWCCHRSLTSHKQLDAGAWIIPDHCVPEKKRYATTDGLPVPATLGNPPQEGRAAVIWQEFQAIQQWAQATHADASPEAIAAASRDIVGINTIPALSLLGVIRNAQLARDPFTFFVSIKGWLPDVLPGTRRVEGSWDIVMDYYQKVAADLTV